MAAAKGFCYALKIPLVTRNTLEVMAESMRNLAAEKEALISPMIDAPEGMRSLQHYFPSAQILKIIVNR